jgi:hypothetical protein
MRHWRGELPLWVSYWVFGFIGNVLIALLPVLFVVLFHAGADFYPPAIFATIVATWTAMVAVMTWQLVGVWRSATAYRAARSARGKGSAWAALAQVAVVLGVLGGISALATHGGPQIVETYRIAFENDPDIPPYAIRVMREGTEAEIVGGFKYGLTDDFEKILNASSQVRLVHLDSVGGRLGEGEKLFRLIRARGLNTYVSSKCMSACTLAFAGGRQRLLRKGASLGFHHGAFPGVQERNFDSVQSNVFRAAGFDDEFIRTAMATPNKDIWRPTADVLLAAKVITGVTDGANFAYSGVGQDFDRDSLAAKLADASPLFKAIRTRFPEKYDEVITQYSSDLVQGRTRTETLDDVRSKLLPFIRGLMPMADDDVLVAYSGLLVDQYFELRVKDPTSCYQYASGDGAARDVLKGLSEGLVKRELSLQERVVLTAAKRGPGDKAQIESLWKIVRDKMIREGALPSDFALLQASHVDRSKHAVYCAMAINMFKKIGQLPQAHSAVLMRDVLAAR